MESSAAPTSSVLFSIWRCGDPARIWISLCFRQNMWRETMLAAWRFWWGDDTERIPYQLKHTKLCLFAFLDWKDLCLSLSSPVLCVLGPAMSFQGIYLSGSSSIYRLINNYRRNLWQGCTVKWIVCTVMCTMIWRQKYMWTLTLLLLCFQGVHLYVFFPFVRVLVHSLLLVCKEISTGVFDIWITLGLVLFACNLCFLCFGKNGY